jgi:hypothetical protein
MLLRYIYSRSTLPSYRKNIGLIRLNLDPAAKFFSSEDDDISNTFKTIVI